MSDVSDPSDGPAVPPELLLNVARFVPARTLLEMALASRGACELLLPRLAPRLLDMVFDYGVDEDGGLEWSHVFVDLDGMRRFVGGSAGAGGESKFRLCRRLVLSDLGTEPGWPWDSGLVEALAPQITDLDVTVRDAGDFGRFSALTWPNVEALKLLRYPYLEPRWNDEVKPFTLAKFPALEKLDLTWPVNDVMRQICEGIARDSPRLKEIMLSADEIDKSASGIRDQTLLLTSLAPGVVRRIKKLSNVGRIVNSELFRRRPDFRPISFYHLADVESDELWAQVTACTSITILVIKGGTSHIVRQLRNGFPPRVRKLEILLYPDLDSSDSDAFAGAERVVLEALARPGCDTRLRIASPDWLPPVVTEGAMRARAAELRGCVRSKAPWGLFDLGEDRGDAEGRRRLEEEAFELDVALAIV